MASTHEVDSTEYTGTVKSYNPAKAWGFVHGPDSDRVYGEAVFLLKSALKDAVGVSKGDEVRYQCVRGKKGLQAANVYVVGASSEEDACFFGITKGLNGNKGYGFIVSDLAKAKFGKDTFLSAKAIPDGLAPDGTEVQFNVKMEDKGPTAINVKLLGGGKGGKGKDISPTGKGHHSGGKGVVPWSAAAMAYDPYGGKGYDPYGGKGGLPAYDSYGGKGYAHDPYAGKGCDAWAKGKGKGSEWGAPPQWQQADPWGAPPQWGPPPPAWGPPPPPPPGWGTPPPPYWGAPPPPAVPAGKGGKNGKGGKDPKAPDANKVYYGSIKTINAEKGWGHIDCLALKKLYGKDIFILKSSFEGKDLAVNMQVQFNVVQGEKGPHATNITQVGDGLISEETFTGIVKSFNDQKGWGFIECAKSKEIYGQDIFLHKKELNDIAPKVDEQVHFSVDTSGGRPVAKNIMLIGGSHYGGASEEKTGDRSTPY